MIKKDILCIVLDIILIVVALIIFYAAHTIKEEIDLNRQWDELIGK